MAKVLYSRSRNTPYGKAFQTSKTSKRVVDLNNEGLGYKKELINCGLKKLAKFYNATANVYQRQNNSVKVRQTGKLKEKSNTDPRFRKIVVISQEKDQLKSQSDFSLKARDPGTFVQCLSPNSTSIIQTKKSEFIDNKIETVINKYTMTKADEREGRPVTAGQRSRSQSRTRSICKEYKKLADPRLCEKYSVLKMPWQKSWTLPAFTTKSPSRVKYDNLDNSDRQTYLFDDGTEIDSLYLEEKKTNVCGKTPHKQCMLILFVFGSVCGILLVSLLIWFIFGNNFFSTFFKPRKIKEGALKKSFKLLGGGLVYFITKIIEKLGYVLALPTQKIYQSEPEYYRWPINPIQ